MPNPLVYEVSEKAFMETIIRMARLLGYEVYHTFDSRRSDYGFPDLVCVHPDHGTLFLETKTERGKVSQHQKRWITALRAAGQHAFVVRPSQMDAVEAALRGDVSELEQAA